MPKETLRILNDEGVSQKEELFLRSVLFFIRSIRQHEVMEIKLNDNRVGELSVVVKNTSKDTFLI